MCQSRVQEKALPGSSALRPTLLPGLLASVLQVIRTVDPGLCRLSPASLPCVTGEGPPVLTPPVHLELFPSPGDF